jgi:hypothetical protein
MKLWKCVVTTTASLVLLSGNLFAEEIVKVGLPMPLTGVILAEKQFAMSESCPIYPRSMDIRWIGWHAR